MQDRRYGADNLKFVLMALVLAGHLLEKTAMHGGDLYRIIYSFHMPAFIFVTGCFARFSKRRILSYAFMYAIFQVLYLAFSSFVLNPPEGAFRLQFSTPYWTLWYLLALIFYTLIAPLLDTENTARRILIFAFSLCAALLSGFDEDIGYAFSASRCLTFLPFFVAGFYAKELEMPSGRAHNIGLAIFAVLAVCASVLVARFPGIFSVHLLYGSVGYGSASVSVWARAALMVISFIWIAFLLLAFSKPLARKHIPIVSTLGANTLCVFLLHGFIVKALPDSGGFAAVFAAAIAIYLLLGNSLVANVFRRLFMFKKLEIKV